MNGYKKDYKLEKKYREFEDVRELIKESSEKFSDRIAFVTKRKIDGDVSYINTTYKELFDAVMRLGTALNDLGFKEERIAVVGDNSYNWCLASFATVCGGGVTVPFDKMLQTEELKGLIIRSKVKIIFSDRKHYDDMKNIMESGETNLTTIVGLDFIPNDGISIVELLSRGEELIAAGDRSYIDAEIDPYKMAFLLFTSGTTQASKGVMLSHHNLMSVNYTMNCEELFLPEDINMMILPLHHIFGLNGILTMLSNGIKNVFCDGLKYIAINLKEYKVSVIMTVPLLLENMYKKIEKAIAAKGMEEKVEKAKRICNLADKVGINLRKKMFKSINEQFGGNMRFFINGAAALDPKVAQGFNELGILTVQGYGLTETAPTISAETYRYRKPGSVGKVLDGIDVKIDKPNSDGIGEVVVRGESVMLGYYEDEETTNSVLKDGWFYTGDLGYFDEDNYLWLTGRKKNVIVMKNGKNVYPEEIEHIVNKLPYVKESMLFSRNKQTDVVLWVKIVYDEEYLKENKMSIEDLEKQFEKDLAKINDDMPAYKMIKRFLCSNIPTIKTTTQKTKRKDELVQIEKELEAKNII